MSKDKPTKLTLCAECGWTWYADWFGLAEKRPQCPNCGGLCVESLGEQPASKLARPCVKWENCQMWKSD